MEVKLDQETVWLSQAQMADLFQTDRTSIVKHIQNIFETGELGKSRTCAKFAQHLPGGRVYQVMHFNLDMIISVGYRINSLRGTQFRIWATKQLKEYLIKGFLLDDKKLAEGKTINGISYFDELLERVRAIRSSQNKFHFAVTGETAAEIVVHRISGKKPYLGMTNWQGEKPKVREAKIAKNYILKEELEVLYLLVEQFLSFAELQIKLQRPMYMKDWRNYLHGFLKLNKLEILKNKGLISHQKMEKVVKKEMQRFFKKT